MENVNTTNETVKVISEMFDRLSIIDDTEERYTAIEHLKNVIIDGDTYKLHHNASRRGYLSRKGAGSIERYNGRFGTGYVLASPRWDTSQYVDVYYYVLA